MCTSTMRRHSLKSACPIDPIRLQIQRLLILMRMWAFLPNEDQIPKIRHGGGRLVKLRHNANIRTGGRGGGGGGEVDYATI